MNKATSAGVSLTEIQKTSAEEGTVVGHDSRAFNSPQVASRRNSEFQVPQHSPESSRKLSLSDNTMINYLEEAKFVLILGMIGVTYPEDLSPATASVVTSVFLSHIFNTNILNLS